MYWNNSTHTRIIINFTKMHKNNYYTCIRMHKSILESTKIYRNAQENIEIHAWRIFVLFTGEQKFSVIPTHFLLEQQNLPTKISKFEHFQNLKIWTNRRKFYTAKMQNFLHLQYWNLTCTQPYRVSLNWYKTKVLSYQIFHRRKSIWRLGMG